MSPLKSKIYALTELRSRWGLFPVSQKNNLPTLEEAIKNSTSAVSHFAWLALEACIVFIWFPFSINCIYYRQKMLVLTEVEVKIT